MGNYIKQSLMQPTPSVANQEKMRMCKFCVHSHISDLGYNHCWKSDSVTYNGDSPTGICCAFRDNRIWKPYYFSGLMSHYRGNICWARPVYNSPKKGKSRIFKYEVLDPIASTIATLLPKEFAKEYIPATPGSQPPHTMKEYEKFDTYCFGGYDPQLTENQEARNYNEARWQEILAQEAIEEQLSKATVPSDSIAGPSK